MNIVEIIKKAPKDHVYWCTLIGECRILSIDSDNYPIGLENEYGLVYLTKDGHYNDTIPDGECLFFPSRNNRDWAAFERELDGKPEEKKPLFHSENDSFDGSVEMVSIPDRPMMAAVIMSGLLAGGFYNSADTLASKAVHYADIILKHTEEEKQ